MIDHHAWGPPRMTVHIAIGCALSALACAPSVEPGGGGGAPGAERNLDAPSVACDTPAGMIEPLTSVSDVYAAIEGRWRLCPPTFGDAPADAIALELGAASSAPTPGGSTVGGFAYFLVSGPSGPVRGEGFAYQLTYDVSPEGPGAFQLNIHPTPSSGFGGGFIYSPSPRELQVNQDANPGTVLLTAL